MRMRVRASARSPHASRVGPAPASRRCKNNGSSARRPSSPSGLHSLQRPGCRVTVSAPTRLAEPKGEARERGRTRGRRESSCRPAPQKTRRGPKTTQRHDKPSLRRTNHSYLNEGNVPERIHTCVVRRRTHPASVRRIERARPTHGANSSLKVTQMFDQVTSSAVSSYSSNSHVPPCRVPRPVLNSRSHLPTCGLRASSSDPTDGGGVGVRRPTNHGCG